MSVATARPGANALKLASLRRAELNFLALGRLSNGLALDWEQWAYCMATVLKIRKPGRYRYYPKKGGKPLQARYYASWPSCSSEAMLVQANLFRSIELVPPEILMAVRRGIKREAARWRTEQLAADTVAKYLGVTRAEREIASLRTIGAIDFVKSDRIKLRADRKRESERERQRHKRRAQGRQTRKEYCDGALLKKTACELAGISLATFKRRSKAEQLRMLDAARACGEPSTLDNISPSGGS